MDAMRSWTGFTWACMRGFLQCYQKTRARWVGFPHCLHCGFQLRSTGSGVCDECIWVHGNVWNLLRTLVVLVNSGQRVPPAVVLFWASGRGPRITCNQPSGTALHPITLRFKEMEKGN